MNNDCALTAISATVGLSRTELDKIAADIQLLAKIGHLGTAGYEIARLLNLLGIDATTVYPPSGSLSQWLKAQEWEGFKCGIYCVKSGNTYHAVSLGPNGYVDLLDRSLEPGDRRPTDGLRRKVKWFLRW